MTTEHENDMKMMNEADAGRLGYVGRRPGSRDSDSCDSDFTFIYALKDPVSGAIRYIGKTDDLELRLRFHISDSKRQNNHKAHWIMALLAKGLQPILEIIDQVPMAEWQAAEAAYIQFFKEEGCNLANGTPGGEGFGSGKHHPCFGKKLSTEHRAKVSAAIKGEKNPQFGKPHSIETKAKISNAKKGQGLGKSKAVETRAKISATLKGKKHPPDRCAKNSKWFRTPEARANMSQAHKGNMATEEARAKMSFSQKLRRQREKLLGL